MSRPRKQKRGSTGAERERRPPSWTPATLAVLRIVRRWLSSEADALRKVLGEYCELEDSGAPGAKRNREDLEEVYEVVRAQQQTLDALIAPQAAEPPSGDVVEMLTLDGALDVVWQAKARARRGMYRRELAAATSPGATAGEPATRGQEGESRQAREPAGPARGPRRAEGSSTESGLGGAEPPPSPSTSQKGRDDE
ncbi:hypothetical protein [Sorangium sp. So ce362]|uniref:hypothetical protein n=1 Tax=Sorangium sp. So ce362 TaxID=3133303 RepID=UPI003F5E207B